MKKEWRELERMAEQEGVFRPRVIASQPHARIIGDVDGRTISIVVSVTKAFSHARCQKCTRLNIRRAVREAKTCGSI